MVDHWSSRRTSPPSPAASIAFSSASEDVAGMLESTCMLVPNALGCVTADVSVTVNGTSAVLTGVVMCTEYQPGPTHGSENDEGPPAVLTLPPLTDTPLMSAAVQFTVDNEDVAICSEAPPAGKTFMNDVPSVSSGT